jgi:hypothetical protein
MQKNNLNPKLVQFLALRLRREIVFTKLIFFEVFLIIRLFSFIPTDSIISTRRHYKAFKIKILMHVLRHHLYEAGYRNFEMHKWGGNLQPLHRHHFLNAMHNLGYFKLRIFKLLYSTALHGFSNSKFHELCDKKGPTMTVYTLNGKMIIAILQKSWNIQNPGWQYDQDLRLFFVDNDGTTTELECTNSEEVQKYLNGSLCGPHVGGLPLDLMSPRCGVYFLQRELITGGPENYYASIDSVVVLQMSICLELVSPSILTRVARVVAPYLRIGRVGGSALPPCFCSPTIATLGQNY